MKLKATCPTRPFTPAGWQTNIFDARGKPYTERAKERTTRQWETYSLRTRRRKKRCPFKWSVIV